MKHDDFNAHRMLTDTAKLRALDIFEYEAQRLQRKYSAERAARAERLINEPALLKVQAE